MPISLGLLRHPQYLAANKGGNHVITDHTNKHATFSNRELLVTINSSKSFGRNKNYSEGKYFLPSKDAAKEILTSEQGG